MKTALVAGATGLVGRQLTEILLKSRVYGKVIILVRKTLDISSHKLDQVIYDYRNPDESKIRADHIFCCLGTTIKKAGSAEAFREIDYKYITDLAQTAHKMKAEKFLFISAIGANKNSKVFYNRVKGETENTIKNIPIKSIFIFRPSLLNGRRIESRPGETFANILMQILKYFIPLKYRAIDAEKVAMAMYKYSLMEMEGVHIIESGIMQKS